MNLISTLFLIASIVALVMTSAFIFNLPKDTFLQRVKRFAIKAHDKVNQLYDNKYRYGYHLKMVEATAKKFIHLVPEEKRENVFAGCWCHDTIEDTQLTYNEVKDATNETVAEIVYALTNEKGRTRAERANDKYYAGIRETPYATFVKLCDRIANISYGVNKIKNGQKSTMVYKYRKENKHFVTQLYDPQYKEMFDYIDELLKS